MTMLPYNTGKVAVGKHYVPAKLHSSTYEEDFWQSVLTRKDKRRIRYSVLMITYMAAVLVGWLLLKWVTR